MNEKNNYRRLFRLIDAALADRLTEPQRQELEQMLRNDDAALDNFLAYCQLETDLFFHVRAALASRRFLSQLEQRDAARDSEMPAASARRRRTARWQWLRGPQISGLSALAAVLLIASFLWWSSASWGEIRAERQPQPIARYAEDLGAEWLANNAPAIGHNFLEGDSLHLTKGQARVSMASGAELVLRGPCFVTLVSSERVQLQEGAVTAKVAEWGRGFTVATASMQVTDLGTKFAVAASSAGVSEAHVLDGKVRVEPLDNLVAERRSLLLSSGEAIRLESQGKVAVRLAADRQRFDVPLGSEPPFKPIAIHNTGTGLKPGDEDPHWRVTVGPAWKRFTAPQFAVVCEADVRYLAANDPSRSQWISICNPARPGVPPRALFTFETTFDLTGYDLSTIMLSAQVIADNGIQAVRLNGQPVPIQPWVLNEPGQQFNHFVVIDIEEGFVAGENRIEFDVWNGIDAAAPDAVNPMALRVEWRAFGREASRDARIRREI